MIKIKKYTILVFSLNIPCLSHTEHHHVCQVLYMEWTDSHKSIADRVGFSWETKFQINPHRKSMVELIHFVEYNEGIEKLL
jgi:hypothetical protein